MTRKTDPTKEEFLQSVQHHKMTVELDTPTHKHLKFKIPDCMNRWFDIVVWPGYLCISGDMGCFVFSRISNMFDFFRSGDLAINPGYYSEKVMAQSIYGDGVRKFCKEKFVSAVRAAVESMELDSELIEKAQGCEDEYAAVEFIRNDYPEYWEWNCEACTYHYIWCLYAIVWAINQYDQSKKATEQKWALS